MAYYNFDGTITIDEIAAQRDIQKIKETIPVLESAHVAIKQIVEQSASGQGEITAAIIDKAEEMNKALSKLMQNLEDTQDTIARTIEYYRQVDQEVKEMIQTTII